MQGRAGISGLSQGRRGSRAVVGEEASLGSLSPARSAACSLLWHVRGRVITQHLASTPLCHQPCLSLRVDVPHGKGSQEVSTLPLDPVLGSGETSAENCLG